MKLNHYEFDTDIADHIVSAASDTNLSLPNAVAHLCAAVAGLCPNKELAIDILSNVYDSRPVYSGWEIPEPDEETEH